MENDEYNDLTRTIIGAAIEVHRTLGPGLLEYVYKIALDYELRQLCFKSEREVPLPVIYKGVNLELGYRADIIVEDKIIVELKAVESLSRLHEKQLLTYLRVSDKRLGLLINFNEEVLRNGIRRIANKL